MECNDGHARDETIGPREQMNGSLGTLVRADPGGEGKTASKSNLIFAYEEDPALDRHYAAHPEDRDADVVIFKFCDDEMAGDHDVTPDKIENKG